MKELNTTNSGQDIKTQVINLLGTSTNFRKWLSNFNPDETVGVLLDPCNCPVANFLKDRSGINYEVHRLSIYSPNGILLNYKDFDELSSLNWIKLFVEKIDQLAEYHGEEVFASAALKVLNKNEETLLANIKL